MACVQGIDTDTGQRCGDSERDQLRVIGRADSGLTIWEDAFGGTFALLPGGSAPTRLPNSYANLVRSQIEDQDAQGVGTISPTAAAQLAQDAQQFDLAFRQGQDEFNRTDQRLTQQFGQQLGLSQEELAESARRFDVGTGIDVAQFNAQQEARAQEINEANRLRVAETNAGLRAEQAQLEEQIRQADIRNAREQENLRFAIRREEIATRADNRRALQDAVSLRETITSRIANTELQRQNATTAVQGLNAQIENNVREFNATETARTEALNEQRRQANIADLRQNAQLIGELSADPSDIGRLAGTLRAGGAGALGTLSAQVAAGENNITGESLVPLRGALGAQEALQQGPTLATPNLIEGSFVDLPQFNAPLGEAPEISDIFNAINFDASGIQGPAGPAAMDLSQFFQAIGDPNAVQAQTIQAPGATAGAAAGTGAAVTGGVAAPSIPIEQQTRSQIETSLVGQARQSDPDQAVAIDPGVSDEALRDFFRATETARRPQPLTAEQEALQVQVRGFAGGGVASPGNPVVVGDGEGDPRELAMTDFFGNLHVTPFDQLPQAQNGGIFSPRATGPLQPRRTADAPLTETSRVLELLRSGGTDTPLATTPQATGPLRGGATQNVSLPQTQMIADLVRTGESIAPQASPTRSIFPDQVIPPAQTVRQTAQNPAVASGAIAPVSEAAARMFQQGAFADTLRRGGFTDPTQISPIRVSAPGTSRFLQDASAAAFGAGGFGPESVFREELARLTPRGVAAGVTRRTN